MRNNSKRNGSILIIVPIIGITLVLLAVGYKFLNTKIAVNVPTSLDIDSAAKEYCENPSKLDTIIETATSQGLTELVKTAKNKRNEIVCALGKKPVEGKTPPKPTSIPATSDVYNNYYWCSSDEASKCELCWIDDNNNETCCYKSTDQVENGNDHCGPNDISFPPSQKTRKDLSN
jgi:hypothetical protein